MVHASREVGDIQVIGCGCELCSVGMKCAITLNHAAMRFWLPSVGDFVLADISVWSLRFVVVVCITKGHVYRIKVSCKCLIEFWEQNHYPLHYLLSLGHDLRSTQHALQSWSVEVFQGPQFISALKFAGIGQATMRVACCFHKTICFLLDPRCI